MPYLCTMEKIHWKVEGMTCANCALTIHKWLEKQGQEAVNVNLVNGEVNFTLRPETSPKQLVKGIENLGYHVYETLADQPAKKGWLRTPISKFFFCLPFTLLLNLHMLVHLESLHWLMNPWVQLALCVPVFFVAMRYFGKSAWASIRNGMPNMNVLIALGATAAFVYSLAGTLLNLGADYQFYETTATIITLVFLGYWLEDISLAKTQQALRNLSKEQKAMANMIAFDDKHQEQIFPVDSSQLRVGDLVLIRTGEHVPTDAKILWGECSVNEAIITGESEPVFRKAKDPIIGSSVLESGTIKAQVTAVGNDTVLSRIIELATRAQGEKPPIQQLADKISAVFVPVVLALSVLCFLINLALPGITLTQSLMRSVAVLVISCPCAMGLATPAAIAVGMGRGARNGILFRDPKSLELFRNIKTIVFDKTGTLTTGAFTITNYGFDKRISDEEFKRICYSLEKFSNHPMAKAVTLAWKSREIRWSLIEERKGLGMEARDPEGNIYRIGSAEWMGAGETELGHQVYLSKSGNLLGWIDLADEIRPEAKRVIEYFQEKKIRTVMLSGDSRAKCMELARSLAIDEVYAEKKPHEKLEIVANLNAKAPTAMVGDGINDAPALAKATIGISLGDASQLAMQHADVVLLNKGLGNLPMSLGLGRHTYGTIKTNLFWAFLYNIIAIPIAAAGFLNPGVAALAMGFSDVVLAMNSLRLQVRRLN